MRKLFWDVENLPDIAQTFTLYNTNIPHNNIIESQSLISIAWKWSDEKRIHLTSIIDNLKRFKRNVYDDYHVTKTFHKVLQTDESFVLIAHNGDRFDLPKMNAAFIKHGLSPIPDRQTIDTLKVARKYFRFDSNRLDYLSRFLNVGEKMDTGGMELWNNIVQVKYPEVGKASNLALAIKATNKMGRYNKRDVKLLEGVYNKLLPFMHKHPNTLVYDNEVHGCTKCGSKDYYFYGFRYLISRKYQRYWCKKCNAPFDPPASLRQYFSIISPSDCTG